MKITALLTSIAILSPSAASAADVSELLNLNSKVEVAEELNLDRCWGSDLAGQLQCFEVEIESCEGKVDHLSTAGGRYACFYEALDQTDQHLNDVYTWVIEQARQSDSSDGDWVFREEMVRKAQREWLEYRDAQSEIGSRWARINSGYHARIALDAARLTLVQAYHLSESVPDDWVR